MTTISRIDVRGMVRLVEYRGRDQLGHGCCHDNGVDYALPCAS